MRKADYLWMDDIRELVQKIGEVANTPVSLYRVHAGAWLKLDLNTAEGRQKCNAYVCAAHNDYRQFAVAASDDPIRGGMFARWFTSFSVVQFPGCCAIGVSTGTAVNPDFQRKGINRLGMQLRIAIARYSGWTSLICTDKTTNTPSIRTISGAGFQQIHQLVNRRTENKVGVYILQLGD
jgi:hypothetical protein